MGGPSRVSSSSELASEGIEPNNSTLTGLWRAYGTAGASQIFFINFFEALQSIKIYHLVDSR
jgi:hypothetical protein